MAKIYKQRRLIYFSGKIREVAGRIHLTIAVQIFRENITMDVSGQLLNQRRAFPSRENEKSCCKVGKI
jgi:hypothetical protein